MHIRKLTMNLLLSLVLITGVIIVSAQIGKQQKQKKETPVVNTDTVKTAPPPDNTEGLAELNKLIDRYKAANLMLTGEINYYENIDSSARPQERTTFTSVKTSRASSYEI